MGQHKTEISGHVDEVINCEALENCAEKQGYFVPERFAGFRKTSDFQIHSNSSTILSFEGMWAQLLTRSAYKIYLYIYTFPVSTDTVSAPRQENN
jgi:hypothetical protein